jgi:hypothetical protein
MNRKSTQNIIALFENNYKIMIRENFWPAKRQSRAVSFAEFAFKKNTYWTPSRSVRGWAHRMGFVFVRLDKWSVLLFLKNVCIVQPTSGL